MTPHVEYELEDAPEHVGREMGEFRREHRHEALAVRVFIGFVISRRADSLYVRECICEITSNSTRHTRTLSYFGRYRCTGAKERGTIALFAILNRFYQRLV